MKEYDERGLQLRLSGTGTVRLAVAGGRLRIEEGETYEVVSGGAASVRQAEGETLVVSVELDGETLVRIGPANELGTR